MQKLRRRILELPTLFVFLSFLSGLSNFVDTFLRLLFFYMLHAPYPLGVDLKPWFLVLQAICLLFFIFYVTSRRAFNNSNFRSVLRLQLAVLVTVIFLFFIYESIPLGKYGSIIYYTDTIWLLSYVIGLSVTCFWFFSILLKENRYRSFAAIFLFIGLAFALKVISEVFFWPQSLFNFSLPSEVDVGSRLLTTVVILLALFYTSVLLTIRRGGVNKPFISILKNTQPYIVISAFLMPFFLSYYKEGLFPLIIRAVVYWGLGYSGQDWYFASIYLVALAVYTFLIVNLHKHFDDSVASTLILLGVVSFPWNGVMVFYFGYSSIPGNMLSLSSIITGFFLKKKQSIQSETKVG